MGAEERKKRKEGRRIGRRGGVKKRMRRRRRGVGEGGGGVNLVTKSFEKMAEFRYMAVRPTSDNDIKEEIERKLRFRECLLSFGSGFLASHLLSRIVQIKG